MKLNLFFVLSVILTSCQTAPKIPVAEWKNVNASVSAIIKAFDRTTPGGGVRAKSPNGREIVGKFHPPDGDPFTNAVTHKVRAYAKISILGDRRPYTVTVSYIVEENDGSGNYQATEYDLERAKKILKDVRDYLVTRPDRDNFIDDFRPF